MIYRELSYSVAMQAVMACMEQKVVPMLHGHPGIAKSAMVAEICKLGKLQMIDLRLSQLCPEDLNGYPKDKNDRLVFLAPGDIPVEGDPVPDGMNGWCLFLDEINTAGPAMFAAAYKLIWDKMVGQRKLHPQVWIVCAGNHANSRAIANSMGTAMDTRIVHIAVSSNDSEGFINWAEKNGIDHRIINYIRSMPTAVNSFEPDKYLGGPFACNRTWETVSKVFSGKELNDVTEALIAGAIGEGPARAFIGYLEVYDTLPSLEEIILHPETAKLPEESSAQFAITGCLGMWANQTNFNQLIKYIVRLPLEFQTITLQGLARTSPAYFNHPLVQNWVKSNAINLSR